jgi:hypothetical protein
LWRDAAAATSGGVMECSPPRVTRNLSRARISDATRRISSSSGAISPKGSSISGSVKMPTPWTSAPTSSSQSSMCDDACRISRGPLRVPETYEVVRSTGTGRTTTCESSNDREYGIAPPKARGTPWS